MTGSSIPKIGVGIYTQGKYTARGQDRKTTREYDMWSNMLKRVYNPVQNCVTYKNCEVSEEFLDFQKFAEWVNTQQGFFKGFHLDKDIICKGNKTYSKEFCSFVPREINNQFTLRKNHRGSCPLGVNWQKSCKRYQVRINRNGVREYLGVYKTREEAFQVYKNAKESHIKSLAQKWKSDIDDRVYNSLMNWEIYDE